MPGVMASAYTLILALPLMGVLLIGLSALEDHFHFNSPIIFRAILRERATLPRIF
jgi:hypothetical protein